MGKLVLRWACRWDEKVGNTSVSGDQSEAGEMSGLPVNRLGSFGWVSALAIYHSSRKSQTLEDPL